jgi:hypothetical protein
MWKFSRTKDERMTLTPCLFMAGNTLIYSVFNPHIIQMWGLVSFIFVRVFPQPSCNKREQASHFLFCIYPSQIVKKEFAENPKKLISTKTKSTNFMKLISNLWASFAMLLMLSLATACENSSVLPEQPEPEYVTVSLGLNVELDCDYEPLTRADENNDLYGIQVYSTPITATENAEWTKYAYGLFDATDNLAIKLIRGYEYKFVATMAKDGKDKINCSYDGGYGEPFMHEESWACYTYTPLSGSFTYDAQLGMNLGSSSYINVELYYGELEGYIPGDNGSKVTIELKRTSFGAKYIAKGDYAENGTLEIIMRATSPQLKLNLAEGNEVSDIFSFVDLRAARLDENYTETVPVTLRMAYSDGTSSPLGTHDITFKRNTTTVVNVDLSVGGEDSVGFVITEGGEMPEDTEITIKDGEIVDTEIETN